ncbi:hypothetical protein ERC79_19130 [Rhodococcus sp. ABRD24]|uniref:DUF6153 family protein n=1 Tax=Rhodococcus sp. ABRD24 TaxID=2507582 RepID=UPI00103BCD05|nr:DUF6153 family protein [Rhodococcus sp. ABRD24]QBJ97818.1 hypothetical protein ERC79_19130 [Rhodococcus sp. ABRD24]
MPADLRVSLTRLAALCALVFGVLAMHHVTTETLTGVGAGMGVDAADTASLRQHHGPDQISSSGADPEPAPVHPPEHNSFHMCLAVLLTATLALVVWLLLWTGREQRVRRHRTAGRAGRAGRGPPFAVPTSVFLSLLCVLRV